MKAKKISTTKIWGILSWFVAVTVTILTIIGVFLTNKDMSIMGVVCGLVWGEVSCYTAMYCYKEKAANKMKMSVGLIKDLAKEYNIVDIVPIIQSIIQD